MLQNSLEQRQQAASSCTFCNEQCYSSGCRGTEIDVNQSHFGMTFERQKAAVSFVLCKNCKNVSVPASFQEWVESRKCKELQAESKNGREIWTGAEDKALNCFKLYSWSSNSRSLYDQKVRAYECKTLNNVEIHFPRSMRSYVYYTVHGTALNRTMVKIARATV